MTELRMPPRIDLTSSGTASQQRSTDRSRVPQGSGMEHSRAAPENPRKTVSTCRPGKRVGIDAMRAWRRRCAGTAWRRRNAPVRFEAFLVVIESQAVRVHAVASDRGRLLS